MAWPRRFNRGLIFLNFKLLGIQNIKGGGGFEPGASEMNNISSVEL